MAEAVAEIYRAAGKRINVTGSHPALIAHCREHLARFKCPREVRFAVLPKTSTGKIQKHVLRSEVKSASAI